MDVVSATKPLAAAEGKAVAPAAGLPTVKMNDGKPATITIPKGEQPPTKTVGQLLVEGAGAKVAGRPDHPGHLHRCAVEGRQSIFDASANSPDKYFETVIGQQQVIKAWDSPARRPHRRQPGAARRPAGRRLRRRRQPAQDQRHRHARLRRRHPRGLLSRPPGHRTTTRHTDPHEREHTHGLRPQHDQAGDRLPRGRRPQPSSSSRTSPRATARRPAPVTPSRPTTSGSRTPPARSSTPRGTAARRWTSASGSARSSVAGTTASSA